MSHFYMFAPNKSTVKLDIGNTGYAQVIGIIFVVFLTVPIYIQWEQFIIIRVTLSTLSHQVPTNFMLVFHNVRSETLEDCDFFNPQDCSCRSPYQTQNSLDYLKIKIFIVNTKRNSNTFVSTVFVLSKQNLSWIIHQLFVH